MDRPILLSAASESECVTLCALLSAAARDCDTAAIQVREISLNTHRMCFADISLQTAMIGPWQNDWRECGIIQWPVLTADEDVFIDDVICGASASGGDAIRANATRESACVDADSCRNVALHVRINGVLTHPMAQSAPPSSTEASFYDLASFGADAKYFAVARIYYAGHTIGKEVSKQNPHKTIP